MGGFCDAVLHRMIVWRGVYKKTISTADIVSTELHGEVPRRLVDDSGERS